MTDLIALMLWLNAAGIAMSSILSSAEARVGSVCVCVGGTNNGWLVHSVQSTKLKSKQKLSEIFDVIYGRTFGCVMQSQET